jgi:hypothetical protein
MGSVNAQLTRELRDNGDLGVQSHVGYALPNPFSLELSQAVVRLPLAVHLLYHYRYHQADLGPLTEHKAGGI